jgi:hypothetical protein
MSLNFFREGVVTPLGIEWRGLAGTQRDGLLLGGDRISLKTGKKVRHFRTQWSGWCNKGEGERRGGGTLGVPPLGVAGRESCGFLADRPCKQCRVGSWKQVGFTAISTQQFKPKRKKMLRFRRFGSLTVTHMCSLCPPWEIYAVQEATARLFIILPHFLQYQTEDFRKH